MSALPPLGTGNPRVDSLHRGPVIRNVHPYHDVIMKIRASMFFKNEGASQYKDVILQV